MSTPFREIVNEKKKKVREIFQYNLQLLRASVGLTAPQLTEVLLLPPKRVTHLETGFADPKIDDIIKIVTYFNITNDDLLGKKITLNIDSKHD